MLLLDVTNVLAFLNHEIPKTVFIYFYFIREFSEKMNEFTDIEAPV